jgi:hypothetical protein
LPIERWLGFLLEERKEGEMKKLLVFLCVLSCVPATLFAINAEADTLTLNAIDSGYYTPAGRHSSSNINFAIGTAVETGYIFDYRNFFVFDLSTVSGIVTSATLVTNSGGVRGSDTYTLYDISTDISALTEDHDIPDSYAPNIYSDIGSGGVYGSVVIEDIDWNPISISMNSAAISGINSVLGGLFAIGGSYPVNTSAYAFFSSGSNLDRNLILEVVPVEPVSIDIKPKACPNECPIEGGGSVEVAILGTADIDVNEIDLASVRLEGVAAFRSRLKDKSSPVVDPQDECDCTTEGRDGFLDLCLKFDKKEIINALGGVNVDQDYPLTLSGELNDGTLIEGVDCIVFVKKRKKD